MLLAYLDFLPAAFIEYGLPLEIYVDFHSLFFTHDPHALTQLGQALHFYGISFRYAPNPAGQRQSRTESLLLAGAPARLLRQRTDHRHRPGQSSYPEPAPPSQPTRSPPRTPNETPAGLEPRPQRETLRSAPGPPLSLVALRLEPAHPIQSRPRWPRAHRLPTLTRRGSSRAKAHPLPPPFRPSLRPGHSAKSKTKPVILFSNLPK